MPENIVSHRDPIFVSKVWHELFSTHGVTSRTSTTYHPQFNRQTEVLNRCLETFLRCYYSNSPQDWYLYLILVEWWYNTTHHSAIQLTPYEALYGQPPPIYLPYVFGDVVDKYVDRSLTMRELKLQLIKFHLARAQQRMISYANAHITDKNFQVGDWVYLKIQPYRQYTLFVSHFSKLSIKYFGPY